MPTCHKDIPTERWWFWPFDRRLRFIPIWLVPAAMLVATLAPTSAGSQTLIPNTYVTDGLVYATVVVGDTLYLGGAFSWVGPCTGSGIPVDLSNGQILPTFAQVVGSINAVVSDGSGGWYVGGAFTAVGGAPAQNLAHLHADGSVSPMPPALNGSVLSLAVKGTTLFVGGSFTTLGGLSRQCLGSIDMNVDQVTSWAPIAAGSVWSMAVGDTVIYVGGSGVVATSLAAGQWVWATAPGSNGAVYALGLTHDKLFAGGEFTKLQSDSRNHLAALDPSTGHTLPWDAHITGGGDLKCIAARNGTCYIGGAFTSIASVQHRWIAALDESTASALPWDPGLPQPISSLSVDDTTVYAGSGNGAFGEFYELDRTTGHSRLPTFSPHGPVNAVAISGNGTAYFGGSFQGMGGVSRSNAAALDVPSGQVTSWNPGPNSTVWQLGSHGHDILLAGFFTQVGGVQRQHVAATDRVSGSVTPWNPSVNNYVYAMAVTDSSVYLGGPFSTVGGQPRADLAAVDASGGTLLGWNPGTDGPVDCMAVSDTTLFVGGRFNHVAGIGRQALAEIGFASGIPTAWNPGASNDVIAMVLHHNILYMGGMFGVLGGKSRQYIGAVDAATGLTTDWNPTSSGYINSIAAQGKVVYAGGSFASIGGAARLYFSELDDLTGLATPWATTLNAPIYSIFPYGDMLAIGGGFTNLAYSPHSGAGIFSAPVAAVPPTQPRQAATLSLSISPNPVRSTTRMSFVLDSPVRIDLGIYDCAGRRVMTAARGDFPGGRHAIAVPLSRLAPGRYYCKLHAGSRIETASLIRLQ